jgi:threonine dehydratase
MALADPDQLASGVYTASAGNMAQGVAWNARRRGIPSTAVVPDTAPEAKLAAIARLGAEIVPVSFDDWWDVMVTHRFEPLADRFFIHPVSDPNVMAGNGTIGLEILEDLPDVEAVVVPYGGGGLSCGIASALRALAPHVRVFASEVETGAPLAASLAAGEPTEVPYAKSFVDGIGSKAVLPEMWPLARELLAGSLVVSLEQTAAALRLLAERNRDVAEGAGATPVAAALSGGAGTGKVVCVISGGNVNLDTLSIVLAGGTP